MMVAYGLWGSYTEQGLSELKYPYLPKKQALIFFFFLKALEEKTLSKEARSWQNWSSAGRGGAVAPWRKMVLHSFLTTPKTSEPPKGWQRQFLWGFILSSFYSLFQVTLPLPHYRELEIGKSPSGVPPVLFPPPSGLTLLLSSPVPTGSPPCAFDSLTPNHPVWVPET